MFTTLFSLQSARAFRQFRVAVFGVSGFLRLAWAFALALNAFSLTTLTSKFHEIVAILLFSINAAAFITFVSVGIFEAFKTRLSFWTSRVNFELGWMTFFLVLETIGATTFTIMAPTLGCDTIIRIRGDAQGAIFADSTPLGSQRPTTEEEASTCHLFNKITLIGSWTAVALSALWISYFMLLCIVAQARNPRVWYSQVNHFDWSVTSEPIDTSPMDPANIKRPVNPHLSKEIDESNWSLPVFVNPWDARKYSAESNDSGADIADARHRSIHMDRHQVMAQFRIDPYPLPPAPFAYETGVTPPPRTEAQRFSVLGLEGMDRPLSTPTQHKRKPTLSINIPTQQSQTTVPIGAADEDYDRIGRTMSAVALSPGSEEIFSARTFDISEEAHTKIGRHMSIPYASEESVSPQHPSTSTVSLGQRTTSTMTAVASHGTVSTHAGSIPSIASRALASTVSDGHETIQFVRAENSYPVIQQTPKRQSTLVRQDSMTARLAMRYAPPLPPPPAVLPSQPSTSHANGGPPYHRQDAHVQGPRSAPKPQHHRSYSDTQGWYVPRVSQQYPLQQPPAQTWPRGYQELTRGAAPLPPPPQQPVHPTHMARIPFFIPPAPNYSPVNLRPPSLSSNGSYARPPAPGQGHVYHSRSSSTPSFQLSPALRDALAPALRDSRSFHGNTASPGQRSAPNHHFIDDHPFGGSRGNSTDSPRSEMMQTLSTPTTPDNGKRRASKLRKSLPRGL